IPNPGELGTPTTPGAPMMPRPQRMQGGVPNPPGVAAPENIGNTTADQIDIQVDERLNRLVITATPQNHQMVQEYLTKYIDLPPDPNVMRPEIVELKYADPNDVVETVRTLLGDRTAFNIP